jgi:hypothetical protein
MSEWDQWYVNVGDTTVGPVSTELVVKGIEHRKVPVEALVCVVGGTTWLSLSSIEVFHAAVIRSYPPPPPDSDEARFWIAQGFRFPKPAPLPRAFELSTLRSPEARRPPASSDVEVEIDWCSPPAAPPIDWGRGFHAYFEACETVELPDEAALLASLSTTPREVFREDEALWNLALCIAFGSDRIGEAAGRAFFAAVVEQGALDRLQWMSRTLLGNGFLPSGIPPEAGRRGFERLRALCPPNLESPPSPRVA